MLKYRWFTGVIFCAVIVSVLLAGVAVAQSRPVSSRDPAADRPVTSEKDLAATQDELVKLLRMSPTLTTVVAHDPSLLSNLEYVSRNNPQLAQFLQTHPEIARNPDFYLFTNLSRGNGEPGEALERKVWPELPHEAESPLLRQLINDGLPFLVFLCILGALLWLIHVVLENRRWGRIFNLQTDVHGKLMDKFATSQELLSYMNTEVGKRFLEAAPITVGFERTQPVPSPVARVLTPLQIGVVMTLLGAGLLLLRHSLPEDAAPLLVVGIVVLMPGLGFIISAGITWVLARHLGLMPQNHENRN
jgi:hypothetical protein